MKRAFLIILFSLLLLPSIRAQHMTTRHLGLLYNKLSLGNADNSVTDLKILGLYLGASFDPFFPNSIYPEVGVEASVDADKNGASLYRVGVPVSLTWQCEPTAKFSIGPFAGLFGVMNFKVDGLETFYGWGYQAGVSIRPGSLYFNISYREDLSAYINTDACLKGLCFAAGFCF